MIERFKCPVCGEELIGKDGGCGTTMSRCEKCKMSIHLWPEEDVREYMIKEYPEINFDDVGNDDSEDMLPF